MPQAPATQSSSTGTPGHFAGFSTGGTLADSEFAGPDSSGNWADSFGYASSGYAGTNSHADSYGLAENAYNSHADSQGDAAGGWVAHADSGGTTNNGVGFEHADSQGVANGYASHADSGATAGGLCSHANSQGNAIMGGDYASGSGALTNVIGQKAEANAQIVVPGDAQETRLKLSNQTDSTTPTELFADGPEATERLIVPVSASRYFFIDIHGARSDGAAFIGLSRKGLLWNDPSTGIAIVSGPSAIGTDDVVGAATGWSVTIDADTSALTLRITVTGDSSGNPINWVAAVRCVETQF